MKHWDVVAYFPQAAASAAEQRVQVKAGSMHLALYRAVRDIRAHQLRGRRLREAKVTVRQIG
jgi:hypothetical protein